MPSPRRLDRLGPRSVKPFRLDPSVWTGWVVWMAAPRRAWSAARRCAALRHPMPAATAGVGARRRQGVLKRGTDELTSLERDTPVGAQQAACAPRTNR